MAEPRSRRWTDPRDGSEWEILHNPPVELDTRRVGSFRSRVIFREYDGEASYSAPSAYGSDLETLTDDDLQGLLDQAREAAREEDGPWSSGDPESA
jgi:hypothetical protein